MSAPNLEVIHRDGVFLVGHSNTHEDGGFAVIGDITAKVPFIVSCVADAAPTDGLNFGKAIAALKDGKQVARAGWNGKGMFLTMVGGTDWTARIDCALPAYCQHLSFIAMKTADNGFVPWLANQTDMLADDWCVVEG